MKLIANGMHLLIRHLIFFKKNINLFLIFLGVVGVEVDLDLHGESDLDPDLIQERIVLVLEKKREKKNVCVKRSVKEKRKEKDGGKVFLPLKRDVLVVSFKIFVCLVIVHALKGFSLMVFSVMDMY